MFRWSSWNIQANGKLHLRSCFTTESPLNLEVGNGVVEENGTYPTCGVYLNSLSLTNLSVSLLFTDPI